MAKSGTSGWMWRYGLLAVAVLAGLALSRGTTARADGTGNYATTGPGIVYVATTGDDTSDGRTWATAKQTVQAGVNTAQAGEQVWVAAGTYVENITLKAEVALYGGFAGTEPELGQRNWKVQKTILDGNKAGSVVTVAEGATQVTRIDGFTVRNGSGTIIAGSSYRNGGGIYCQSASPTIRNNIITNNSASNHGGGIYSQSSAAAITSNTITANSALGYGGGIYSFDSNLTVASNTIAGNNAYYGGGVYCFRASPVIANNIIAGNGAQSLGGGLYCENSLAPLIANNTITGNGALGGGGMYCAHSFSPTITNTIVAFNSSGVGMYYTLDTPSLQHNCVYGNDSSNYSGLPDPTGTNENISVDPRLASAAYGCTHLQPGSPCIDAGDDGVVQVDWKDADGQARVAGGHVDIGADESDASIWPVGPYVVVRVSPSGDDANDGSSWALAKRTVQAGAEAAASSGGEVWVQAGTYQELVTVRAYAHLYGGFAGNETDLVQRNWSVNRTILAGNQAGSVVTVAGSARGTARVDGFVIRKGKASYGQGISCMGSSPTIANNRIADCTGAAIYCCSSCATIMNNTITGNAGYGVWADSYSPLTIVNNTITSNGCAGVMCRSVSATIANTIIAFNGEGLLATNTAGLRCNCVYGNSQNNYWSSGDPVGTNGNVSVDPKLADRSYGNVHIQPDSPCIDAGDDSLVGAGWKDIDAQERKRGVHVDIGADESDETVWPVEPYVVVRVSRAGDDANDGLSWSQAKRTVQAGIDAAAGLGGEVWVAAGTYVERITLRDYAYLYGGFAGTEAQRSERNWSKNATILDGNQGGSVVTAVWLGCGLTTIDGFAIRNGSGKFVGAPYNSRQGGGIYCGAPVAIANNTIAGNSALGGGGIYCSGSSPVIVDCTITGNSATAGAGIVCAPLSSPRITHNTISGNSASSNSGGISCAQSSGTITNNVISGNRAPRGAGINCFSGASPVISGNTISGNTADGDHAEGAGIHCDSSSPTIASNTISGNIVSGLYNSGGGIFCCYSNSVVIGDNTISGNSAWRGGGIYFDTASATVTGNTILSNVATWGGGVCCAYGTAVSIAGNTLSGNIASGGGGIYCSDSYVTITNNAILGNAASRSGGGIDCSGGSTMIADCIISGNSAQYAGGVECETRSMMITHTTIVGNTASSAGGGIGCYHSSATIANTIIAFNSSGIDSPGATPSLEYSCVYGNTDYDYSGLADPTGTDGNISADPLLVRLPSSGADGTWGTADDDYGDLHLLAGSPCINVGDPAYVPAAGETDLDGQPRIVGGRADIGADEFCWLGDANYDGYVNVGDLQVLVMAWGRQKGDANYNAGADGNGDGVVNVADLMLLVENWGKSN